MWKRLIPVVGNEQFVIKPLQDFNIYSLNQILDSVFNKICCTYIKWNTFFGFMSLGLEIIIRLL